MHLYLKTHTAIRTKAEEQITVVSAGEFVRNHEDERVGHIYDIMHVMHVMCDLRDERSRGNARGWSDFDRECAGEGSGLAMKMSEVVGKAFCRLY